MGLMKRFYKTVAVVPEKDGFAIKLDGRPVKTPARNALHLPTDTLAQAVTEEWAAQGEDIDGQTMPLNALAEGALDQIGGERSRIISRIAAFADSDMLYYRADEGQPALAEHQAEHWDPLLDWSRSRYDISFNLVRGIIHQPQPEQTIKRLTEIVETQDDFAVAAMLSIVGLTGSLTATLALVEGDYDSHALWPVVNLEELWQEQQWGTDDLAVKTRAKKQSEFQDAERFLLLSRA